MVFENGEELSEDRTPILDERDSVSYEEFGGDQVHSNATKETSGDVRVRVFLSGIWLGFMIDFDDLGLRQLSIMSRNGSFASKPTAGISCIDTIR